MAGRDGGRLVPDVAVPVTPPFQQVELRCSATVNDQTFEVRLLVDREGYDRYPEVREHAHQELRERLLRAVMKKYPPEIQVRR